LAITDQKIENPTTQIQIKGVKRKMLYDILSKQELESLFNNFEILDENSKFKNQNWFTTSQLASKRNKVILGLLIYQGLGTTELGRLTEKDLKLREGKIFIAGTRRSNEREMKLEAHQVLDIMEYTLKTRQEILNLNNKTSESLFVSAGESNQFRSVINKLIKKLNKQSSKVTSVFQIRTSVITHWLKIHNLRQVQHMAGHRYVSSTESYFVNDLDDLQEDITKYHPIG
jgi:integrase/recombinase XerD